MKRTTMYSMCALALGGCANAPEVSYTLYDVRPSADQAPVPGMANQLAQKLVGDEPGKGAIKYAPTGSYVLISVPAPKPAAGTTPKETPCDGGKPASGGDGAAGVRDVCKSVNAALETGSKTTVKGAKDLSSAKATLTASPGASSQYLIAITPTERFYFKPNISATFEGGTQRLTTLGAESDDKTVSLITQAFGAFSAVAPIFGLMGTEAKAQADAQSLDLPYVLDLTHGNVEECISTTATTASDTKWCKFDTKLTQWEFRLSLKSKRVGKPLYRDAAGDDAAGFFTTTAAPTNSREFPYAPCIRVALHIRNTTSAGDEFVSNLTIGDPTRVETYLIPAKGSITLDAVCGANLKPANYTGPTVLEVVKALADGINQLKSKQAPASTSTKK